MYCPLILERLSGSLQDVNTQELVDHTIKLFLGYLIGILYLYCIFSNLNFHSCSVFVRQVGLEPTPGCPDHPLKVARLPFRHCRICTTFTVMWSTKTSAHRVVSVGIEGLEPSRPEGHQILNLGWLPVSAYPHKTKIYSSCLNPKVQDQENLGEKLARTTSFIVPHPAIVDRVRTVSMIPLPFSTTWLIGIVNKDCLLGL